MRITKRQIRRVIKESIRKIISESYFVYDLPDYDYIEVKDEEMEDFLKNDASWVSKKWPIYGNLRHVTRDEDIYAVKLALQNPKFREQAIEVGKEMGYSLDEIEDLEFPEMTL